MLDRNLITVDLMLRSGAKQVFEVTEDILEALGHFQSEGSSQRQLSRTWLQLIPRDPPARVRLWGQTARTC